MKTFEELKQELLSRAKNARACAEGYRMGLESQSKSDLLKAITVNWFWVLRTTRIVDISFLEENFTKEELSEAGIYTSGCHEVRTTSFVCGSATVTAFGRATVTAFDRATVEAYDSATVEAFDSATVEAFDSATVRAFDNATVRAYGSATVRAFDNATVTACDRATVTACDNSYVEDSTGNIRPQSGYAIVKDNYNHKIYIKKGKFEIVEVN